MKVVIDTNALLAMLPKKSTYRLAWDKLIAGEYEIAVTTEILLEYSEILAQKTSPMVAENVLKLLTELPNASLTTIYYHFNLIYNDADDNKFVDCAIAANVKYIVSNDKHFNVLKQIDFLNVEVVKIEDFIKSL